MRTSCLGGFPVMLVPKLLLTPIKIRIFGPKTAKFGPKSAFLVILGQILPFFAHFVQWPTKNNVNKVPRWVFRYVGNKTFDFSSKKKGFFAPKRPNLAQNWHFWSIWPGHASLFSALLVGRLVVVARGLYLTRHLFTLYYYDYNGKFYRDGCIITFKGDQNISSNNRNVRYSLLN